MSDRSQFLLRLYRFILVMFVFISTPFVLADFELTETFDSDINNTLFYYYFQPDQPYGDAVVENGELRLKARSTDTPGGETAALFSRFTLNGDFTVRVDFRVLNNPHPLNGAVNTGLCLDGGTDHQRNIQWVRTPVNTRWNDWPLTHNIATSDLSGTLEFKRTNGMLYTYVEGPTTPRTMLSQFTHGNTASTIAVYCWRASNTEGSTSLNVGFDNLSITADSVGLIVNGTTVELWGQQKYDSVSVINCGSIVVPQAQWVDGTWQGGYLMLEANNIYVDSCSSIHADECGFSRRDFHSQGGPGVGRDGGRLHGIISGSGAGFGGYGGSYILTSQPGIPYGSATEDDTHVDALFGSEGGDFIDWEGKLPLQIPIQLAVGGRGGGYVRLKGQKVVVEGTVSANGGDGHDAVGLPGYPTVGSGGGSGGQIVIDSPDLTINGTVEAKGGSGNRPDVLESGGGGAGGRIKILQPSNNTCSGNFFVDGGAGCRNMAKGENGTIYFAGQPASTSPTDLSLHSDDDTGIDHHDNLTNISTPRIVGNAPAKAQIVIYSGSVKVGAGQSDDSGRFTVQASLPDGEHTLTATAQEACHAESPQSIDTVTITVDTSKPATPSSPDMIEDRFHGGASLTDNITSDASPTFEGTVDPGATWVLMVDGTEEHRAVSSDGTWSWTINPKSEGTHSITVKAVDDAGNESAPSSPLSVTLDLTDPVVSNIQISPIGCQTAGQLFTIQANVSDALSGLNLSRGVDVDIRASDKTKIDSIELTHQGSGLFTGTWDSKGVSGGTYLLDFTAWDIAGNEKVVVTGTTLCIEQETPYCGDNEHPYPQGDLDQNCYVNLYDFALFSDSWGSGNCEPLNNWCSNVDFDQNGSVGLEDLALMASEWLNCADPYPPCVD